MSTTTAIEHVGEIERLIKFTKERARCVISDLCVAGFKYLHKLIVMYCLYFMMITINAVPAKGGISEKYSPREIVTGRKLDTKKDCRCVC